MEFTIKPRESYLDEYKFNVASAGIWIIVTENNEPAYFIAVQQADQEGNPWAIPAGKVDDTVDKSPVDTAIREVYEETGIQLGENSIKYLWFQPSSKGRERAHIFTWTNLPLTSLNLINPEKLEDETILFDPANTVGREEVSKLALIPIERAFDKDNILNKTPYRFEVMRRGIAALRALGIFPDNYFPFERDYMYYPTYFPE